MSFKNNFLFAPKVKSGYLEEKDRVVYWLNGESEEHNAFGKLVAEEKTRQQGWQRAVFHLACDENGQRLYKGNIGLKDFEKDVDRTAARDYGMMILGVKKGDERTEFEEEVQEEVKNSSLEKAA